MNELIAKLIDCMNSNNFEVIQRAISYSALLIERHALNKYGEPLYEQLLPKELLGHKLSDKELRKLLNVLTGLLDQNLEHASSAAWALGKSYSDDIVPNLVRALKKYWQLSDEITYQILVSLDNYGMEHAKDVLALIAIDGHPKSREFVVHKQA